ncbi:MAG: hypothetical protein KTR35_13055 [Gammaproteobacteria bacterium]|nr:hypothetical protein [Gammaproteobacteria bacterium]
MKQLLLLATLIGLTFTTQAQSPAASAGPELTLEEMIFSYSVNSGEKVVVDPRVKGRARVFGKDIRNLSFEELLTVLDVYNMATYRVGELLMVVPANEIKAQAIPLVTDGKSYSPSETVTDIISMKNYCGDELLAMLRPLLAPTDHFVPVQSSRAILITSTYVNTQRIREMVDRIDELKSKKSDCSEAQKE